VSRFQRKLVDSLKVPPADPLATVRSYLYIANAGTTSYSAWAEIRLRIVATDPPAPPAGQLAGGGPMPRLRIRQDSEP
jgi:hypothetical protein